jgi:hypothetical protein
MKCSNPTEFKARMLDAGLITAEQAAAFATM